jgi:hypothetical protein
MSSRPEPAPAPEEHRYRLFDDGRALGWLVWRPHPRQSAGWYLAPDGGTPRRLKVDAGIDELAADGRSDEHAWRLHAEVAAILSTALALDAAERALHDRPPRRFGRFGRVERARYEIYVKDVSPRVLGRAVPEMAISFVSDVVALEGDLPGDAVPVILRRLSLLGGTVVEVMAPGTE